VFRVKFDRLKLARDRRGVMAIMFAFALIPLIIVVSLAIDYGFAVQARSQLNLAADAAAMQAVRVASQSLNNGATVAQSTTAGINAGQQWFAAQLGSLKTGTVPANNVNVALTYTASPGAFTANVTYSGTIQTQLGLSGILPTSWSISGNATALVSNSYLEVLMMLDNSSSMQIGATSADIETLMALTACSSQGAWYPQNYDVKKYPNTAWNPTTNANKPTSDPYQFYECTWNGSTYNGSPSCPAGVPVSTTLYNTTPLYVMNFTSSQWPPDFTNAAQTSKIPTCKGSTPGATIYAGAPCAFACHSDTSKPAGQGFDYYGLARTTITTATPVTLRFDVLKTATNALLQTMQKSTQVGANLSVGIYAFNSTLTQVYPNAGEAGANFTAAISAVGLPPTQKSQPDTGIQPETLVGNAFHADTNFNGTMQQLASQVTASGDGMTATSPRKVLFIITDGVEDFNCSTSGSCANVVQSTQCQTFKNLGFAVYVLYTPYYPLMHIGYLDPQNNVFAVTQGTGPGTVPYALQQCATNANDYIQASDVATMTDALELFLNTAVNGPGRITN
jgi:Flp pilus assembly protein TadG